MTKSKATKKTNAAAASSRRSKRSKVAPSDEKHDNKTSSDSAPRLTSEQVDLDSREALWWEENVDIASELIKSCKSHFDWDEATAKRVLTSYRQFMVIIMEADDLDSFIQLHPCWSVDQMWRAHSLISGYRSHFETICGHEIITSNRRWIVRDVDDTIDALKNRFGNDVDWELWSSAQIRFEDQLGETKLHTVYALQPVSTLFFDYAYDHNETHFGTCSQYNRDYSFFIDQKNIPWNDMSTENGMTLSLAKTSQPTNIIVKAINTKAVKITFRHSNGDGSWIVLIRKTTPLHKYFTEFTSKHLKDVDQKDLVFSHNGKKLYTFDTATTLKLNDGDIIDVALVNEYITPGCICCQKRQNPFGL